ncbi:MAG TPA: acylphosphatase [Anaeromyxobacteraceae bacterium]|nr:acylphosphatase [Anaeromyxobacteraceae bacterium]
MKARARIIVSGRVQGVAFRAAAQGEAYRLGISGWVRNCEDGDLEALAEGEKEQVLLFIEFCRRGPRFARVSGVEVRWEEAREELASFDIRG